MAATVTTPVVFDIGNVLVRWDPCPPIAAAVGEERAREFLADPEFDFGRWNLARDAGEGAWVDAETTAVAAFPHWREAILAYRQNFRLSLSGGLEGSHEIIRELLAAQVPVYGLTNWAAELFPMAYEVVPVLHELVDIIVSGVERVAKPDPRIWTILAQRTGRPLRELVFTDDSVANIESARVAGIDAILFEDPEQLRAALVERGYAIRRA